LGILLVVFGHNRVVGPAHPELFSIVFSFHMPLFFFLSGITFKANMPFLELVRRRWRTLLLPYAVTILLVVLAFFVTKYRFDLQQLGMTLLKSLYGSGRTLPWQWLWFLPLLFLVNMFFGAIQGVLSKSAMLRAALFSGFLI